VPARPRGLRVGGRDEVGLGEGEDARQAREPGVVELELALDDGPVVLGIGPVDRGEVQDVDEELRPLHVGQEVVPEARALRGALDDPRDVGEDELAVGALERPEDGLQRREGVVGHLRHRAGHDGDQRGLARVGQPDEPHVGQELEPQVQPLLVAGEPALGEARRLARGGLELRVAAAARAAAGHDDPLAGADEVVDRAVRGADLGARRDGHEQRLAVGAVALGALAVAPAAGLVVRPALEGLQVAQVVVADQHDVAAAAAVAAVGPAAGDVGLPPEGVHAVAARAGLHEDARLVVEHWRSSQAAGRPPRRVPGMESRVFLITGASTGIGAATARAAVARGIASSSPPARRTSSTRSPPSSAATSTPWRWPPT
jgi:hypothetical protein